MAEDKTPNSPDTSDTPKAEKKPAAAKTAPKKSAKQEKPPAVEEKPFDEFIEAHFIPSLRTALEKLSVSDLQLSFDQDRVTGSWASGQRRFTVYFLEQDINKAKAFSWATSHGQPAVIESFLIDERKITLDLLVFGVIQRLNAQKWFGAN
ncbi:DUF2996 domain-containing protein [Lyngbya confervoides]|uniref:DUF2996 domain-containing protein n=1 Tax=Lyngbya confervoides BDU141951 TaxID=1574623 RepID=A0ABD4T1V5_9CYAN|nr:DUF2996 domain-containing protein [Lyngbya confervoides]MCM1982361.1 DUF2996 domain-containing protein [Lyngbya confervoides BDU141951]